MESEFYFFLLSPHGLIYLPEFIKSSGSIIYCL